MVNRKPHAGNRAKFINVWQIYPNEAWYDTNSVTSGQDLAQRMGSGTHMQEIGRKLAGVWQKWSENWDSADRHARNRAKTRRCVAEVVENRGICGHTCKKTGKKSWVCGEYFREACDMSVSACVVEVKAY